MLAAGGLAPWLDFARRHMHPEHWVALSEYDKVVYASRVEAWQEMRSALGQLDAPPPLFVQEWQREQAKLTASANAACVPPRAQLLLDLDPAGLAPCQRQPAQPVEHVPVDMEKENVSLQGAPHEVAIRCYTCEATLDDHCPLHPLNFVTDCPEAEFGDEYAVRSVPTGVLRVAPSPLHGSGVFACVDLQPGTALGPFKGRVLAGERVAARTGASWLLFDVAAGHRRWLNSAHPTKGNWTRFVNTSADARGANVVAVQVGGCLWLVVSQPLRPGQELLVWYGEKHVHMLGDRLRSYGHKRTGRGEKKPAEKNKRVTKEKVKSVSSGAQNGGTVAKVLAPSQDENGSHKCQWCGGTFLQPNSLVNHQRQCAARLNTNTHECSQCGAKCKTSASLRKHIAVKHERRYQCTCDKCGKVFNLPRDLQKHIQGVHEKLQPHQCSVCSKRFSVLGNLRCHMRTHTGERPFHCAQCTKCFARFGDLKRHIRSCHKEYAD